MLKISKTESCHFAKIAKLFNWLLTIRKCTRRGERLIFLPFLSWQRQPVTVPVFLSGRSVAGCRLWQPNVHGKLRQPTLRYTSQSIALIRRPKQQKSPTKCNRWTHPPYFREDIIPTYKNRRILINIKNYISIYWCVESILLTKVLGSIEKDV